MNWYILVLKKYAVFTGRARRREYWMFFLFNLIFAICAAILDRIVGTKFNGSPYGYIYLFYILAIFIPHLAVCIRRLHDIGKTGWWFLISLIPVIGWVWIIVLAATAGTPGENEYGQNPKEVSAG